MPVIVNGALGKMGSLACQVIHAHPDFVLVGALGRHDDLNAVIEQTHARIVIDFTGSDCVFTNALSIINQRVHPIIGTTGLTIEQITTLQQQCQAQKLGGIIAPNFSISALLMMHCATLCASFHSEVEIVETHHLEKLDSPSGTAIKTADLMAAARISSKSPVDHMAALPVARGAAHHGINIHSIRAAGVITKQEVILSNTGETLTITHECIDRNAFMPGLMLACQRVLKLKTLYYGLEKLLKF
ncbi:MAG: 4-hydroxy-tetrahydrodipicolinate reductase [Legionellales bacterium]|nr:4-hydroxy-tetrahydrodipicolinate reductase [Legionellales bacterium]